MSEPIASVGDGAANGRDPRSGRFATGNRLARGNPHARRVARLRAALLRELSAEDLGAIVRKLIEQAKAGDVTAAREVLDRALGRPRALDIEEDRILTERAFGELCGVLVDLARRRFGPAADELFEELSAALAAQPEGRRRR